ncbi:MAG: LacI family DNA-binding transcriptional regulator [Bacteroidetes bacterium]|nr:LacI family DNA-binding transcriptional regulator [Bacteroidota bacterium]
MNLKEFAKALNLSASTVSRALNDSHEISTKTKLRVLELAKEMNFEPNPFASNLRRQKNKTIAVVVPDITNHFFAKVIEGIESIAQEKGYHILIYFTLDSYLKEVATLRLLSNGRVGGIILSLSAETNNYDHIRELKKRNIPFVFFDRVCEEIEAAKVTTDNKTAAHQATKYLLERGCRRIAFLNFSEFTATSIKRKIGYIDALTQNNIEVDTALILNCSTNKKENIEALTHLLTTQKDVDAIFASSENLSIISYQVCESLGINIPQQIKLIGFSNMTLAAHLNPSFTCITQPAFEIGNEAATILFKSIEKPHIDYSDTLIQLNSSLVKRNSTN